MPRLLGFPDGTGVLYLTKEEFASYKTGGIFIHCAPRAQDLAGSDKPLAQGKPARSRAKSKPSTGRRKAGAVSGKK